jgi:hypothetical protein
MRLRRSIPAGLVDAGFASLGTFAVGLVAIRLLAPEVLGAYALFMSGFKLIAVIPAQLVLVPAETEVLSMQARQRVVLLKKSLRLAAPVAALGALLIPFISFLVRSTSARDLFALASTATVAVLLSPLQDHVRRLLHLSDRSAGAAVVSIVQFVVSAGTIAALWVLGVRPSWIPFTGLIAANAASISVGTALCLRNSGHSSPDGDYQFRNLFKMGGWLTGAGMVTAGSAFVASAVVSLIAGQAILGFAEAARVVAQPLNVLALGVGFVINPRSMAAAYERDRATARRISRVFVLLLATVGTIYLLVTGLDVPINPLTRLFPNAFTIPWLVAASIATNLIRGLNRPYRSELVGAKEGRLIVRGGVISDSLPIAIAFTAPVTHAFAIPLGQAAAGVVSTVLWRRYADRVYGYFRPDRRRYTAGP